FLSTTGNLAETPLPVARVVRRTCAGAKLAILSDTPRASPPLLTPEAARRLAFAAPKRLAEEAAMLKREGCVVVVASHGFDAEAQNLARSAGADLVLQGHYRTGDAVPERLPDPPVLRIGDMEYVSVFAWRVRGGAVVDFEFRRELVDKRWPMDDALWKTYEDYTRVALRHAGKAKARDGMVYTGSAACGACHAPQLAAYEASAHAHAYATLVHVGRDGDPECLSCHTTGFESASGFDSIRTTSELANVNCQDCHGFSMKEHDAAGFKAPRIEPAKCTRCHTPTTDPAFDFPARRAAAGCNRAGGGLPAHRPRP
ncbi:MAG TPA: multiheme c-type cytochrome, partial [Planctomycetota bacterium]|nr:multiheme c-type cytochrome [Planctomycetota bacterium]